MWSGCTNSTLSELVTPGYPNAIRNRLNLVPWNLRNELSDAFSLAFLHEVLPPFPLGLTSETDLELSDIRSIVLRIWPHSLRRLRGVAFKSGFRSGSRCLYATDVTTVWSHANRFKNLDLALCISLWRSPTNVFKPLAAKT